LLGKSASASPSQHAMTGDQRPLTNGQRPAAWLRPFAAAIAVIAAAVFVNWPILSAQGMRAVTETNLGTALQADGRLDEATPPSRRAIELGPDYAPAYNNLAVALRAKGDVDEAIGTYERALALRPEFPDAHYNLANALLDAHRADE